MPLSITLSEEIKQSPFLHLFDQIVTRPPARFPPGAGCGRGEGWRPIAPSSCSMMALQDLAGAGGGHCPPGRRWTEQVGSKDSPTCDTWVRAQKAGRGPGGRLIPPNGCIWAASLERRCSLILKLGELVTDPKGNTGRQVEP